jgi:hypothetical protein
MNEGTFGKNINNITCAIDMLLEAGNRFDITRAESKSTSAEETSQPLLYTPCCIEILIADLPQLFYTWRCSTAKQKLE